MLRPGGRAVMMTTMKNVSSHGFFQKGSGYRFYRLAGPPSDVITDRSPRPACTLQRQGILNCVEGTKDVWAVEEIRPVNIGESASDGLRCRAHGAPRARFRSRGSSDMERSAGQRTQRVTVTMRTAVVMAGGWAHCRCWWCSSAFAFVCICACC